MNNVIQFQVQKESMGYSASALNFPIVTQADTLDSLELNIREATELYFEDQSEYKKAREYLSEEEIKSIFLD
jgi:predicted RNase H-like HicB family nuclease